MSDLMHRVNIPGDAPVLPKPAGEGDQNALEPDFDDEVLGLFDGDQGVLDLAVRNTLVTILKTRFISRATHPTEWAVLTSDRSTVLSRLHDLLIDLHIDPNTQTALKVPVRPEAAAGEDEGDLEPEELMRVQPWTVLQAGLLVSLREHYHKERGLDYDVPVLVETDELVAMGARYVPSTHRDDLNATRKINAAIEALRQMRILTKVRGVDDRYRVSPVVESLLPVDVIRRLTDQWRDPGTTDTTPVPEGSEPA